MCCERHKKMIYIHFSLLIFLPSSFCSRPYAVALHCIFCSFCFLRFGFVMNKTNDIFHTINNGLNVFFFFICNNSSFNAFRLGFDSPATSNGNTNVFDAIFRLIFLDYLLLRVVCCAPQGQIVDSDDEDVEQQCHKCILHSCAQRILFIFQNEFRFVLYSNSFHFYGHSMHT